jgi:hypothetical protein
MQRISIDAMPIYGRQKPLTGYELSHIVSALEFEKINTRGQVRRDKTKKAVLRALCDRYPNVWPGNHGPEGICQRTGCSPAQVRRIMRELEHVDKLIVDVNSRITWHKATANDIENGHPAHKLVRECDDVGKKGGRGPGCTPQYFICDRKIYDAYQQQETYKRAEKRRKASAETRSCENENRHETRSCENEETRSCEDQTHSFENPNPLISEVEPAHIRAVTGVNPLMVSDEPTILITNHKNQPPPTTNQPPTAENLWGRLADVWKEVRKENLSKAGWKQVRALRAEEDAIVQAWAYWIRNRNLDGLLHPVIMFAEEFPEALAAFQQHDQQQAVKAANDGQVAESEAACGQWRRDFEAFAKQANSAEIDSWVQINPAPVCLLQGEEGMVRIEYAKNIIDLWKFSAEKKAEKDRMRQHYADDAFCSCPECQPDFWKETPDLNASEEGAAWL